MKLFKSKNAQVNAQAQAPGVLQKIGRVLKEKAGEDFQRVFQGTQKTRQKLGVICSQYCIPRDSALRFHSCVAIWEEFKRLLLQVVEELLAYWNLEDADDTLEELEEVLIVSSFKFSSL